MGLLDSVIGSVTGRSATGSGRTSPLTKALLLLLTAKLAHDHFSGPKPAPTGTGSRAPPVNSGRIETGVLAGLPNLDTLLGYFRRGGHEDKARSWISPGENHPIRPDELQQALGPDTLDRLQRETGLPRDQLLAQLASALPQVVDKLTPHGRLPTPEETRHW